MITKSIHSNASRINGDCVCLAVGRREGIHQSVSQDVAAVFKGKTAPQLQALQSQIENKILDKSQGVDINYWECLLSQLKGQSQSK